MAGFFTKQEFNRLQRLKLEIPHLLPEDQVQRVMQQFNDLLSLQAPEDTLNKRLDILCNLILQYPALKAAYKKIDEELTKELTGVDTRLFQGLAGNPIPNNNQDGLFRCPVPQCDWFQYQIYEGQKMECKKDPKHGQLVPFTS